VQTKTRREEALGLIEALDGNDRALLMAAVVAQGQGRLSAAARVVEDRVEKGAPAVAWVALLVALDSAELRLGGTVKITTPATKVTPTGAGVERWGVFSAQIWPSGTLVSLRLDHPCEGGWELAADPASALTLPAIGTIARSLAMHFGRTVTVVNARNGKPT